MGGFVRLRREKDLPAKMLSVLRKAGYKVIPEEKTGFAVVWPSVVRFQKTGRQEGE